MLGRMGTDGSRKLQRSPAVTCGAAARAWQVLTEPRPHKQPECGLSVALRTLCVPLFNTCIKTLLLAMRLQGVGLAGSVNEVFWCSRPRNLLLVTIVRY